jgi:hypothetical protein
MYHFFQLLQLCAFAKMGRFHSGGLMINKRILKTGAVAAAMTVVFAIFSFRAADWRKGLSSEFIVYGQSGSGTTGGTGSTGLSANETTKVLPQISAGAYDSASFYGTVIEITNPNGSAITVSGKFYNEDGTPSTLAFATNLSSQPTFSGNFSNLSLPAGSILVISIGTTSATSPKTGSTIWGTITGSNTISVASFFELRRQTDSALYSRVGIPASLPNMTSFVIPRVREKTSVTQPAEIETGFAVVNTGTQTAMVTAKLIDANGNVIASGSFPLVANGHKAGIVNSAFSFLSPEAAGRQYQYMLFTSDKPTIGAAAIAFEGGNLTSFPVDPIS